MDGMTFHTNVWNAEEADQIADQVRTLAQYWNLFDGELPAENGDRFAIILSHNKDAPMWARKLLCHIPDGQPFVKIDGAMGLDPVMIRALNQTPGGIQSLLTDLFTIVSITNLEYEYDLGPETPYIELSRRIFFSEMDDARLWNESRRVGDALIHFGLMMARYTALNSHDTDKSE
jgi:hypothetical protein